jgi:hypothetical protein
MRKNNILLCAEPGSISFVTTDLMKKRQGGMKNGRRPRSSIVPHKTTSRGIYAKKKVSVYLSTDNKFENIIRP